jgi:hypothetical protein
MIDRSVYLDSLVSRPWTPDQHCWAFVCDVRRALFNCEALPPFGVDLVNDLPRRLDTFATHIARTEWVEVFNPHDGDVVIMTRPGLLHAGLYLVTDGRGRVWHSDRPHGVTADTLTELTQLRRWKPRFFRRAP